MTSAAERALGDDTLVFLHLPKTGGTALRTSLLEAFDPSAIALIYPGGELDGGMTVEHFRGLPEDQRARMRLVIGHVRFGIHESIPGRSQYAILLRDPVDRIVSLYYHYRNLPGVRFGSKSYRERLRLRLTRTSLEDWVFSNVRPAVDNTAVRNITSRPGVRAGACPDDMLDEALEHVNQHFIALLVTERMQESTALLSARVGRPLAAVGTANRNPRRPDLADIDQRVLDRIGELNRLDVKLYRYALKQLAS